LTDVFFLLGWNPYKALAVILGYFTVVLMPFPIALVFLVRVKGQSIWRSFELASIVLLLSYGVSVFFTSLLASSLSVAAIWLAGMFESDATTRDLVFDFLRGKVFAVFAVPIVACPLAALFALSVARVKRA
jgi:hypothetical protein